MQQAVNPDGAIHPGAQNLTGGDIVLSVHGDWNDRPRHPCKSANAAVVVMRNIEAVCHEGTA
jgi:hypothetical protein